MSVNAVGNSSVGLDLQGTGFQSIGRQSTVLHSIANDRMILADPDHWEDSSVRTRFVVERECNDFLDKPPGPSGMDSMRMDPVEAGWDRPSYILKSLLVRTP